GRSLLRHPTQSWHPLLSRRVAAGGQNRGLALRSNDPSQLRQRPRGLPGAVGAHQRIDPETAQTLVFLTNQFHPPALMITSIYRLRCAIELFFRWIKQPVRLRGFFS